MCSIPMISLTDKPYPGCNFGTFVSFELGAVRNERVNRIPAGKSNIPTSGGPDPTLFTANTDILYVAFGFRLRISTQGELSGVCTVIGFVSAESFWIVTTYTVIMPLGSSGGLQCSSTCVRF